MVKSNQYRLKIASSRVQEVYDNGINSNQSLELRVENDEFNDDLQCFVSWMITRYGGKHVIITVQIEKTRE